MLILHMKYILPKSSHNLPNFLLLQWFDTLEFNRLPCSNNKMYELCGFRWSIQLTIYYVLNWSIDGAISTPSCWYCIWNRYCQNHRSNHPNFLFFAWFETLEFNRLPFWNNKMYDDAVCADRFQYQLTMFGIGVLIGLSRLLRAHIACKIDTFKIIAAFFRISYCSHDLIRLNLIICLVQTTRCTMMLFPLFDSSINYLCL